MRTAEFRARAGTLTVLYVCSAMQRHVLLRMLEEAAVPQRERSELPDPNADVDIDQVLDPGEGPAFVVESDASSDPDQKMEITPAGVEMHFIGNLLEEWLGGAPDGPLKLGDEEAGMAVAGLVYGWETTTIHALARQPLGLAELNRALVSVDYRAIEEHIDLLEETELVEQATGADGVTRYAVTEWLREGLAPLAAAARLERHFPAADTHPPDHFDVEAAFQLTLPLLELPPDASGACRLGVRVDGEGLPATAGVTVTVERGRIAACSTELEREVDAWAVASPIDWLDTLVDPAVARIETGGGERLAASLLAGLHERLFAASPD